MSWLTLAWSMVAGACLILGLMHLSLWLMDRKRWDFLLFSICAGAAAGVAIVEQIELTTGSLDTYRTLDRWVPVLLAAMLVGLVWFAYVHLGMGR